MVILIFGLKFKTTLFLGNFNVGVTLFSTVWCNLVTFYNLT